MRVVLARTHDAPQAKLSLRGFDGDGDVIEVAKATCLVRAGVVPRRADNRNPGQRPGASDGGHCVHRGAGGDERRLPRH